jgi:hypothetical protein
VNKTSAVSRTHALALLLVCVLASLASGDEESRGDSRVKDPVLARLVWLAESDFEGTVGRERLSQWASGGESRLPVSQMAELRRQRGEGTAPAVVQITFRGDVDVPFPYGLLGYKPGRLRSSPVIRLHQWSMGDVTFESAGKGGADVILEDVHIFRLVGGHVEADFDAWLDKLLGPVLEDTRLEGLFFYRDAGSPRGAVVGTTPAGKVHVGVFNLERDGALFPTPSEIKVIGGRLYHWMVRQTNG